MPFALLAASPVGPLELLSPDGQALSGIRFAAAHEAVDPRSTAAALATAPVLAETARQLAEYVAGERRVFDLPLAPRGSPFQQSVWTALLEIPYGQTRTYGDLARRLGLPLSASRAVGAANGANPIPVVIPCHRVIGADGRLTGYGGGLERKAALLRLEGVRTECDQLQLFSSEASTPNADTREHLVVEQAVGGHAVAAPAPVPPVEAGEAAPSLRDHRH